MLSDDPVYVTTLITVDYEEPWFARSALLTTLSTRKVFNSFR